MQDVIDLKPIFRNGLKQALIVAGFPGADAVMVRADPGEILSRFDTYVCLIEAAQFLDDSRA